MVLPRIELRCGWSRTGWAICSGADRSEVLEPRDVVLNERRQATRTGHGLAPMAMLAAIYPPTIRITGLPSGRSPITRRRWEEVRQFFATYYHRPMRRRHRRRRTPTTRARWSALLREIAPAASQRSAAPPNRCCAVKRGQDRIGSSRRYPAWITPSMFAADDANRSADIANGKTSRLYRRLVRDARRHRWSAAQNSREAGGFVQVAATAARPYAGRARTGHRRRNQETGGRRSDQRRSNGARPGRSAVITASRRSADSAASPISSTPGNVFQGPGFFSATGALPRRQRGALREAVRRYLAN